MDWHGLLGNNWKLVYTYPQTSSSAYFLLQNISEYASEWRQCEVYEWSEVQRYAQNLYYSFSKKQTIYSTRLIRFVLYAPWA